MSVPLRMRVQDWLADHFRFVQYSVPRRKPVNDIPATDYRRLARDLAVGCAQILLWLTIAISAIYRMRKQPGAAVAALLLVYFASLGAGKVFSFLI
jgi:hypothetical protein